MQQPYTLYVYMSSCAWQIKFLKPRTFACLSLVKQYYKKGLNVTHLISFSYAPNIDFLFNKHRN